MEPATRDAIDVLTPQARGRHEDFWVPEEDSLQGHQQTVGCSMKLNDICQTYLFDHILKFDSMHSSLIQHHVVNPVHPAH